MGGPYHTRKRSSPSHLLRRGVVLLALRHPIEFDEHRSDANELLSERRLNRCHVNVEGTEESRELPNDITLPSSVGQAMMDREVDTENGWSISYKKEIFFNFQDLRLSLPPRRKRWDGEDLFLV